MLIDTRDFKVRFEKGDKEAFARLQDKWDTEFDEGEMWRMVVGADRSRFRETGRLVLFGETEYAEEAPESIALDSVEDETCWSARTMRPDPSRADPSKPVGKTEFERLLCARQLRLTRTLARRLMGGLLEDDGETPGEVLEDMLPKDSDGYLYEERRASTLHAWADALALIEAVTSGALPPSVLPTEARRKLLDATEKM